MVQRSKHMIYQSEALEMKRQLHDFHRQLLQWCAKAPIGEPISVSFECLNHAVILTDRQLQGLIDKERRSWPPGELGLP